MLSHKWQSVKVLNFSTAIHSINDGNKLPGAEDWFLSLPSRCTETFVLAQDALEQELEFSLVHTMSFDSYSIEIQNTSHHFPGATVNIRSQQLCWHVAVLHKNDYQKLLGRQSSCLCVIFDRYEQANNPAIHARVPHI